MENLAPPDWDVVVIGGGAAGLMAAIHAAERGRRVLLLEKNRKPGVKILMSGGTRCNITHSCDNRGIVAAYGKPGKFLHSALAAFSVQQTIQLFEAEGVATKVEDTGKIFPVSNKALDVLEALLSRLRRSGATLALEEPVNELDRADAGLRIVTPKRTINTSHVILTTGGQSFPGCGTRGDGYRFAAKLGHAIVALKPSLVPITIDVPWVNELRGVTLEDVGMKVLEKDKTLSAKRGGFLFAHFGLTGPAPLNISKAISLHADPKSLELELDFLPGRIDAEVDDFLKNESLNSGKKQLASVLSEQLPRRLADTILTLTKQPLDRKASGLAKADRLQLVTAIKHLRIPVRGTLGFEKAEVTAGGVSLDEVDSRTMQSKIVPGLFLAGEVLDLDGPIGGFNFQAAWSTGWLAGRSV
ncbi:BaiN/RdsA family NAD(P)/FAD-dependent oxidoreductase [Zavarzinella formosa]|uniref:NAD(P)/FAD-dependent oxidoreductase n=1 Tax=Zavarzinella formosa TaxID=360055 RepID=UPI00035C5C15|nr:NAD(P)/FAD-dependent oxidoreductase [Zavarzinella formosa]